MPAPDFLIPAVPAGARDLSDDEVIELDDLLDRTPEPLQPMDVVMLDGYLCGLLVQVEPVAVDDWLPYVFDGEGRPLPADADPAWRDRTLALVLRRQRAIDRALTEDGGFDPLILDDIDDDAGWVPPGAAPTGDDAVPPADAAVTPPARTDADPQAAVDGEAVSENDEALTDRYDDLPPISRPLVGWVAGFQAADLLFGPEDDDVPGDDVLLALSRIYRHLPAEDDDDRALRATLDAEMPLADVDEAVDDLVAAVADLADLARERRYRVETVRRDAPKVGRNDPCPCGSGKKYKRCHGAAD